MEHPVHNLILVMIGPDHKQIMVNLTVPEPGAKRLAGSLSSISHHSDPASIKTALIQGFNQVDTVVANEPGPPIQAPEPPEGEPLIQFTEAEIIAVAMGDKHFAMNDGDVTLRHGPDNDGLIERYHHILTMIAKGEVRVALNDAGKPYFVTENSISAADGDGAGQGMPGADPEFDGSVSGEKHTGADPGQGGEVLDPTSGASPGDGGGTQTDPASSSSTEEPATGV